MNTVYINGLPYPMSFLAHCSSHDQNEIMSMWFMNNFDRVNFDNRLLFESVRYDEVEPYEVLKEVFGDWVPGDVIGDASAELEPIGDDIWVPAIDYSTYWPIPANDNDSFDVFQDGIKRIREMMINVHLIGDANSQRHLIQLLYADVITTLETYLVQVYIKKVFESDETIINFLNNHNDLKAKFNSIDLTDLMKGDAKAIIEQRCDDLNKHIQNLSWHNPAVVSNRFDKVDIKIDLAKTGLKELIQNRHDIIHRSGKSIEGRPFGSFNKGDIEKSIVIVVGIAEEIDRLTKDKAKG